MPLKTLVKVGSISNLSDARYSAGMGVDFLGFRVIAGVANAIAATSFQEIRGWVTGPQIVAEIYGITDVSQLPEIVEQFRPDFLELGLAEFQLVGHALTLPYFLKIEDGQDLPPMASSPAYIILDAASSALTKFIPSHDVLLTVNNTAELDTAIAHTGISGVCLVGGVELRPGLKTYDEIADILEALEAE
jgi:phosphoribosylanthranilate isomerase